ncbi:MULTISPECIES: cytochrome d ubiquinol oxidase subunit II [Thalassospira]|uniref:Ubiquinol oxidase subunit II n=2 Tax=Thalassospira xiamenensis TaxID=220697 RepID=A0A367XBX7_9PROT|nr:MULTISPECIES: cytochrome d ubiquinol oxidase subunit II [Thalassospira]KZB54766.1 ubiquinol oxidase subunit II [Thalassospira xiamenensis]MAZ35042.1 cytochrome d ubiquinol oxidase subunit II [Thalassospira sp.]OSQ30304.1 ubiquinol oxidase subunit II [Thalassospira sp. MCCC 1A03138]RCK32704.1 ubiquinol oxidase subunit II [Thalassospira xiamenensis]RCK51077.1 ubiquinol oxidase subunit II [Thalassospira xiamenensis]
MIMDYQLIWALLIAVAVFAYVTLDGFDLGIGILFPFIKDPAKRGRMMNTVAPVWDGNETWLVLGGGGLYAAFPLAYSLLMTAFYIPVFTMLLALVFRGVAFEFRFKSRDHQKHWDFAFSAGSIIAAAMQGAMLGAFIEGIAVENAKFVGGPFDWLSPFSVFCASAVVVGYALLGTGWLIMKMEGNFQGRLRGLAKPAVIWMAANLGVVSLMTSYIHPAYAARWFDMPNLFFLAPIPIVTAGLLFWLWHAVKHREKTVFGITLGIFFLCYAGFGITLYPNIVPPMIDFRTAAAPDNSLSFMLVGAAILIPIILAYTAYAYWVFRGKVGDEGYH